MGVEYAHGLFVADMAWRPAYAHVGAIMAVLEKWKLASKPTMHVSDDYFDKKKTTDAKLKKAMPDNLRIRSEWIRGAPVVAVIGDSQYGLAAKERYFEHVTVVLGVHVKVLQSESFEVEVKTPAKEDGEELELDAFYDDVGSHAVFRGGWDMKLPKLKAPKRTGVMAFSGMWRSGVVLECNKDLPDITGDDPLPATKFHAELEKAFGTKLVQCGWYH